jgi:signal peptidase I
VIELNEPKRGDIVVFRFPKDPSVDYIKRVIGLPGDKIGYYQKMLYINDKPIKQVSLGEYQGAKEDDSSSTPEHLLENLNPVEHSILVDNTQPILDGDYIVPEGHYFVMGDNRDNSNDSRYWGTVPEQNLVGRAFFIWMSWDLKQGGIVFNRIGTVLQ